MDNFIKRFKESLNHLEKEVVSINEYINLLKIAEKQGAEVLQILLANTEIINMKEKYKQQEEELNRYHNDRRYVTRIEINITEK